MAQAVLNNAEEEWKEWIDLWHSWYGYVLTTPEVEENEELEEDEEVGDDGDVVMLFIGTTEKNPSTGD